MRRLGFWVFSRMPPNPLRVLPLLERLEQFYTSEVRPREEALRHRLTNRDLYLDIDGYIQPEVQQARREIMRASGKAGLYSLHLPERVGGKPVIIIAVQHDAGVVSDSVRSGKPG